MIALKIIGIALKLLPMVLAWFSGRQSAENSQIKKSLGRAKESKSISSDVSRLPISAVVERLRKWKRG